MKLDLKADHLFKTFLYLPPSLQAEKLVQTFICPHIKLSVIQKKRPLPALKGEAFGYKKIIKKEIKYETVVKIIKDLTENRLFPLESQEQYLTDVFEIAVNNHNNY